MQDVIEVHTVTKRYGKTLVLDRVSAAIPEGQVIGLLGHNGAGKTTLIKLALGLIRPTVGEMRIFGLTINERSSRELHRRIGYLPENVAFYGNLTGHEVIRYLAKLKGASETQGIALLRRVGLASAMTKRVRAYSKGMRQRLGLAQALLGSPDLFFLDEPTTGLDPVATREFFELVRNLRKSGKTVVISSHLLAELEPHLDQAVILKEGRVLAQGTLAAMQENVDLPVTICARVVGKPNGLLQEPWLVSLPTPPLVKDTGELELAVPIPRKMDVMRHLMELPTLADIAIKEPTLARLYATIGRMTGAEDRTGDA